MEPVKELTLQEFQEDWDWGEVFADKESNSLSRDIISIDLGDTITMLNIKTIASTLQMKDSFK